MRAATVAEGSRETFREPLDGIQKELGDSGKISVNGGRAPVHIVVPRLVLGGSRSAKKCLLRRMITLDRGVIVSGSSEFWGVLTRSKSTQVKTIT